jgi:fluoride ion exporter CrcB/FEX
MPPSSNTSCSSCTFSAIAHLNIVNGEGGTTFLAAISLGFAGSLSTVSTYVKETVELSDKISFHDKKAFVYSPLVRYAA